MFAARVDYHASVLDIPYSIDLSMTSATMVPFLSNGVDERGDGEYRLLEACTLSHSGDGRRRHGGGERRSVSVWANTSRAWPSSSTRPWYITMTREKFAVTNFMSCEIVMQIPCAFRRSMMRARRALPSRI